MCASGKRQLVDAIVWFSGPVRWCTCASRPSAPCNRHRLFLCACILKKSVKRERTFYNGANVPDKEYKEGLKIPDLGRREMKYFGLYTFFILGAGW